ncbi:MAG: phosphate acyltransferase PlsX [Peptostreptococcales bacterium]
MRIAVDGMGGDYAPIEIVKGCVDAISFIQGDIDIIGNESLIQAELEKYKYDKNRIQVIHASEVITNEDKPVRAVRSKKDSSIVIGMERVREKKNDVFISAGNTGAIMTAALLILGRIQEIDRPVIASPFLGKEGPTLLVDAGANAECKPRNLVEFGMMGNIYMEKVLCFDNPKVALVNIGEEEGKGTKTIQAAHKIMKQTQRNFVGNIEARDLLQGKADILVCDGFIGNIILKYSEGIVDFAIHLIKEKLKESILAKIGIVFLMGKMKEIIKEVDYSEYGGAPILGVKGAVVKMHGSSKAKAVKNAIIRAIPYVENNVVEIIHDEVNELQKIAEGIIEKDSFLQEMNEEGKKIQ